MNSVLYLQLCSGYNKLKTILTLNVKDLNVLKTYKDYTSKPYILNVDNSFSDPIKTDIWIFGYPVKSEPG